MYLHMFIKVINIHITAVLPYRNAVLNGEQESKRILYLNEDEITGLDKQKIAA